MTKMCFEFVRKLLTVSHFIFSNLHGYDNRAIAISVLTLGVVMKTRFVP